ncbi:MAG: hypothetical protein OEZ65_07105 [Gemmatimonadota bacterium]|nr:hypothetical protein [Gemmatimonadota bacterium]
MGDPGRVAGRVGVPAALVLVISLTGCRAASTAAVEALPGDPLPEITAEELARFGEGKALFNRAFTSQEGLGPLFNQTRCSSCHDLPASGGHGAESVTKVTRFDALEGCSLLSESGGDLLQASVTSEGRALGLAPERIPEGADGVAEIQAPPLYGLGLVDAVPAAAIAAAADPYDLNGDGISGLVGTDPLGGPGRFGGKASQATLGSFIESATRGELGLTTPAHPVEDLPEGRPLPPGADPSPDPEVDAAFLAAVEAYVRFLAVPRPAVPADEAAGAVERGRGLFESIGCARCHTPTWTTGPNPSPSLDRKTFRAYSDFLLHDMGPELADICGPGAAPSEWRTSRLAGLRFRSAFMHHGRAGRLEDAVELHGGEGARARAGFRSLPEGAQMDLLAFLRTL